MALVQQLIGGLAFGVIYSLVALGFTMVLRALDLVHFGQGEMLMLGGVIGFTFTASLDVPYGVTVVLVIVATGVVGAIVSLLIFQPLRRRGSPSINMMIATIGLALLLQNVGRIAWGSEPLQYPEVFSAEPYEAAGLLIPSYVPWITIVGGAVMLALHVFFTRTATGTAMRASAADPPTGRLMGINPERMILYTFVISGALGGAAGVLLAPIVFASFDMGIVIGIKAFVAATVGGLGSIYGAMVGGPIVGLVETAGAATISSAYKDAFAYALLIIVLLIRPRGLLGGMRSGEDL